MFANLERRQRTLERGMYDDSSQRSLAIILVKTVEMQGETLATVTKVSCGEERKQH